MYYLSSDLELRSPEVIYLEPEDILKASRNSAHILEISQQWSVYLHGLAVYGFKSWLKTKMPTESLQIEKSTLFEQQYTYLLDEACCINCNSFKLCIIATENIIEDVVYVSQASIKLSHLTPHFYIIAEILEEQEEVYLRGFLESSHIREYIDQANISPSEEWKYPIPLSLFNSDSSKLSFYIKYLNPSAFRIPSSTLQISNVGQYSELITKEKILGLDFAQAMSEQLDAQEALQLLSSPQLLNDFYNQSSQFKQRKASKKVLKTIYPTYLNLIKWVNSGLDQMAQDLGFLDTLQAQPASQLRTTHGFLSDKFEMAIAALRYEGLNITEPVKPIYNMVSVGDLEVCLGLISCLTEDAQMQKQNSRKINSLLILAGNSQQDELLPVGFEIEIRSDYNILESYKLEFEESLIYSFVDLQDLKTINIELITPDSLHSTLLKFIVNLEE